jgi:hydrophobe/amphiphile efflux-3 (HAE3) family protein
MRRYWEWLGLNLGKHAGIVGVVGLLVTLVLGIGLFSLRFSTSNSDYLNKTDRAYVDNTRYEALFGGDPMATLITMRPGKTIDDFFTPANQALMKTLDTRLAADHWVYSEVSPLDALSISSTLLQSPDGNVFDAPAVTIVGGTIAKDPSPKGKAARLNYLGKQYQRLSDVPADRQILSNPAWVDFLVHDNNGSIRTELQAVIPNNHHALFAVYLQPNLTIAQESTAAASVNSIVGTAHFQNATTITTGVPAVLQEIQSYLKGGILLLGGIAAIVMVIILILLFNVRWRLLPFAIVGVGMIWAFGLVGFFGIPLTLATISALPVLLGVGMDYAIQMHSRIEEEVVLDRAAHPVQAAARGLGPALLVVTFDAVFAFAALWFAHIPVIRQFGSLLVVGIIAVCVFSMIATLAILGIREYRSPTRGKDFSRGRLSRIVVFLANLSPRVAVPAAVLSILIFVAGVAMEGKLVLQTNPIQWLNPNSQAIKDINALKAASGSDNELGVVVTTDRPFSNQTVDYVVALSHRLQDEYPKVLYPGTGIVNSLDQVLAVPGASEVPPTGPQVEALYLGTTPSIQRTMVANGGLDLNIIFRTRTNTLSDLVPVVNTLEHEHPPPGMTVAPGGIAIVGVGLLQNLASSRVVLTNLALLFVGMWLVIRLRSLVRSLLSLIPVLVAVGAVTLLAIAFGVKLSPMTAVAGPLVVAVCTEFTSLMLLRFVEERNRGHEPREAMRVTAARTGRAFLVSAGTAIAGIAVIATSPMPLLRDFGIIVALNVGVALLSALVVLPPILVWADASERGWVSRGMLRPVPEPYEFEHLEEPPSVALVAASNGADQDAIDPDAELTKVMAAGNGSAAQRLAEAQATNGALQVWVAEHVAATQGASGQTTEVAPSTPEA